MNAAHSSRISIPSSQSILNSYNNNTTTMKDHKKKSRQIENGAACTSIKRRTCTCTWTSPATLMMILIIHLLIFLSADSFSFDHGRSRQTMLGSIKHSSSSSTSATATATATATKLYAKNTNKNKKRLGGPRGAGRRGKKAIATEEDHANHKNKRKASSSVPAPTKIRKRIIELTSTAFTNASANATRTTTDTFSTTTTTPPLLPPLRVCTVEIDDVEWWENPDNKNPYGARLWPSALAISEFLVAQGNLNRYEVLELGCGAGLVSIVAAERGACVVASDVSPTVLKLCKIGWRETQKQIDSKRNQEQEDDNNHKHDDESNKIAITRGSLNTCLLDIFSEKSLPLSSASSTKKVVIATAMMYESSLATILARKAFEACSRGAWVIIGDDDTGNREGGRERFVAELDQLEKKNCLSFQRIWTSTAVRSKVLRWNEKQVKILHMNPPDDIALLDSILHECNNKA